MVDELQHELKSLRIKDSVRFRVERLAHGLFQQNEKDLNQTRASLETAEMKLDSIKVNLESDLDTRERTETLRVQVRS
jgi:hypothetical protein